MPNQVRDTLTDLIKTFIWGKNVSPRLALDYLHTKRETGGIKLLNLRNRNEAIELIWLKEYLKTNTARPTWAKFTDALVNDLAPAKIQPEARQNTFLQKWKVPTKGKRAKKLGNDTIRMIKSAHRHRLTFAPLNISQALRKQMPAWQHLGVEKEIPQNPRSACLVKTHNSTKVKDLLKVADRLDNLLPAGTHFPVLTCHCEECIEDRANGCENPQRCAIEAQNRLNKISLKLNPNRMSYRDNLSLTHRRKEKNATATIEGGDITFDPSVTIKSDLADCFRIMVDPEKVSNIPAERQPPPRGTTIPDEEITVYTDGSCMNNGKLNAKCGAGIWAGHESNLNTHLSVLGPHQSNQIGELAAVIKSLEITPSYAPLTIITDSRYVIDGLTQHLMDWEDQGWIEIKNKEWFKRAAYLLRKRSAPTAFKWVKGHSGEEGNEESDALAKKGAEKETPDELSLEIPPHFDVQGAKLSKITQAIAYRGLRELDKPAHRRTTVRNLEKIRSDLQQFNGSMETDEAIWGSIRSQPIKPKIQDFLFKSIHGTHKIGRYWLNIENLSERGRCTICNQDETLEHILTECLANTRAKIWDAARDIWPYDENLWPPITLGIILGSGLLEIKPTTQPTDQSPDDHQEERTPNAGATRLAKVLISEAAYLIWTLRCGRVINDKTYSSEAIESTWRRTVNKRLAEDVTLATKIVRREEFTKLINNTWYDALRKKHGDLPDDWIKLQPHF